MARAAYAAALETERVALMRKMRAESVARATPLLQELWTVKGRELGATRRGQRDSAAHFGRQLKAIADRFNAQNDLHVAAYAAELERVGIDADGVAEMSRSYVAYMISSQSTVNTWTVPDHLLERFPEDVRKLLRSDGAPQTSQSPERAS